MNRRRTWTGRRQILILTVLSLIATNCSASPATFDARDARSPLHLVRTIPLPGVHGRIDHMALAPAAQHLFVAELGNGTVDDVDLASGSVAGRIPGLQEPQGIAWLRAQDEIAVACGDGSVRFYRRTDRREVAELSLGDDADNVRIDPRTGYVVVGYGSGGLAEIDPTAHRIVRQLKLPGHPEAFVILGSRVFVNVPDAHKIVIGDLDRGQVIEALGTRANFGNYPMAVDHSGRQLAVAFRFPSSVSAIDAQSGQTVFSASACGDADDVYFRTGEMVIVCGEGTVDLIDFRAGHATARVITQRGARTGLFDAEKDRLFVAVPEGKTAAAIWELSFRSTAPRPQ